MTRYHRPDALQTTPTKEIHGLNDPIDCLDDLLELTEEMLWTGVMAGGGDLVEDFETETVTAVYQAMISLAAARIRAAVAGEER